MRSPRASLACFAAVRRRARAKISRGLEIEVSLALAPRLKLGADASETGEMSRFPRMALISRRSRERQSLQRELLLQSARVREESRGRHPRNPDWTDHAHNS